MKDAITYLKQAKNSRSGIVSFKKAAKHGSYSFCGGSHCTLGQRGYSLSVKSMDIPLLSPLLNLKSYLESFSQVVFPCLACPRCREKNRIIKYGLYYRIAIDLDEIRQLIPVQRFLCKVCGKTFSFLPPFLARYKPYCIQAVSPLIETYLNSPLSLFKILYEKFYNSIMEYRSLRLYLNNLIARSHIIYSLVLRELLEISPSWNHHEDPRFLETPSQLKRKVSMKGLLELYQVFLVMEHYITVAEARFPEMEFPDGAWLILANHILFLDTYSTIF